MKFTNDVDKKVDNLYEYLSDKLEENKDDPEVVQIVNYLDDINERQIRQSYIRLVAELQSLRNRAARIQDELANGYIYEPGDSDTIKSINYASLYSSLNHLRGFINYTKTKNPIVKEVLDKVNKTIFDS